MSHIKKWKEILPEPSSILDINLGELNKNYLDFRDKTLILIDLETMGFHPSYEYEQIIEIAVKLVNGDSFEEIEKFNCKVSLLNSTKEFIENDNSVERYNWKIRQKKSGKAAITIPSEILKFTKYDENKSTEFCEKVAIKKLFEIILTSKNPILVAHNTEFDINYILTRGKRYGLKLPLVNVIDTLKLSRYFFIPLLKTIQSEDTECKDILTKLTDVRGRYKHTSSRLGDLANSLGVKSKNWHTATADVEMMFSILLKMLELFKLNKNCDIYKEKKIFLKNTFRRNKIKKTKR